MPRKSAIFDFGDVDDGASVRRRQRVESHVGGQHCRDGFPRLILSSLVGVSTVGMGYFAGFLS